MPVEDPVFSGYQVRHDNLEGFAQKQIPIERIQLLLLIILLLFLRDLQEYLSDFRLTKHRMLTLRCRPHFATVLGLQLSRP